MKVILEMHTKLDICGFFYQLSLGGYLCWWTITPEGSTLGGYLCWWNITAEGSTLGGYICWWNITPEGSTTQQFVFRQ